MLSYPNLEQTEHHENVCVVLSPQLSRFELWRVWDATK